MYSGSATISSWLAGRQAGSVMTVKVARPGVVPWPGVVPCLEALRD
jgi:hypothetical protein